LETGADDYVVKPCTPEQIIARVRALLRRDKSLTPSGLLTWGELSLDTLSALVTYCQQVINLRSQEYQLLTLFLRHPQRLFSHSDIIDHLWPMGDNPSKSTVTNLVKDMRRKLKLGGMKEDILETLYGLGYRLKNPPQIPVESSPNLAAIPEIRSLSTKFRESLAEHLAILETATQSLATQQITPTLRQQAQEEAHRLAGSLGTYGYAQGSALARRIEIFWQQLEGDKPEQIQELQTLMSALKSAVSRDVDRIEGSCRE
jgi:DNA-binding winged helix-turn-helix (wHTH) protein